MFTGIVQEMCPVVSLEKGTDLLRFSIAYPHEVPLGASVAIDGVCLTVAACERGRLFFDAIEETLQLTTLSSLQEGRLVNLERSAKFGDEIGGHLLSGHIVGTAQISSVEKNVYTFSCDPKWRRYLFSKGFVALDGASLTLVDVNETFTVHLIPETLRRTTLGKKGVGDLVNLEIDSQTRTLVDTLSTLASPEKVNLAKI